jgi:hypothetical protein
MTGDDTTEADALAMLRRFQRAYIEHLCEHGTNGGPIFTLTDGLYAAIDRRFGQL